MFENSNFDKSMLIDLLKNQVRTNFLLDSNEEKIINQTVDSALQRTEQCFKAIGNKYYSDKSGQAVFNPFHSGQYSIFLYFFSREAWQVGGERTLADKIYYLNKTLNCCDLYHEIELPDVFFLEHPLGSVLGRASYGNYFVFQQNCTVGGNHGAYPRLGEYVWLFANATVIGNSTLGDNVFVSAGTYVKDTDIPSNTIVFGRSPNLVLKTKPQNYFLSVSPFSIHRDRAHK